MTSGRATRRGAETSKLTILEPGLGDGSPRSPKTRRNATEATPQSRYSRHSGTSSQKSSRGSPAVSQNENKISLFKRGHVPQLHLVKKSGFTNAVQEVMNSETSRKEDNSNGPQLKVRMMMKYMCYLDRRRTRIVLSKKTKVK